MSLRKTSLLNGIAVVVRVLSGLVLNKVLAVYVGPAGYAIIGQFQNVASIIVNLAGGVVSNGVTKITAEHFDDESKQHTVWQTAFRMSLIASLIAGLSLLVCGRWLSEWLLHRTDMYSVFVWMALTLPAMAANNLLMAVVNGKKEVSIYVAANILGSLLGMLVTGLLVYNFGLYGALIAYVINLPVALITTALLISRRNWFDIRHLWGRFNRTAFKELSGFGLMGLTSALTVPVSYMIIRETLVNQLGLSQAGYWQASWRISEIYLMLVTTTLSVYYLPRLAEIRIADEMKAEIFKVYRFVLPIVVTGSVTIYLLRDFIIQTLFTSEFLPMRELFAWQLFGDVIKISSWILSYVMLGRAMVKTYIATEIGFSMSFVVLSWLLVSKFGLVGVSMAYAINYSLYWVAMAYVSAREMKKMKVA